MQDALVMSSSVSGRLEVWRRWKVWLLFVVRGMVVIC